MKTFEVKYDGEVAGLVSYIKEIPTRDTLTSLYEDFLDRGEDDGFDANNFNDFIIYYNFRCMYQIEKA